MSASGGNDPSYGGFLNFVTGMMAVPNPPLDPSNPPAFVLAAYNFAVQFVNPNLIGVPGVVGADDLYAMAVYYLAADTLITFAMDAPGAPIYKNNLQYWQYLRNMYGVFNFVAGVVSSTSDEGTSSSYEIPETFKGYTIANINNLKTPYGRMYLGIAGSWGTVWGLT